MVDGNVGGFHVTLFNMGSGAPKGYSTFATAILRFIPHPQSFGTELKMIMSVPHKANALTSVGWPILFNPTVSSSSTSRYFCKLHNECHLPLLNHQ